MRQTFYGGNYALTDVNNMPNPVRVKILFFKTTGCCAAFQFHQMLIFSPKGSRLILKCSFQDYWLSYLHKQFVGSIVLSATTMRSTETIASYWDRFWSWIGIKSFQEVRVYAHCTKPR